ncbi:hypothetical protein CDD81_5893 [Ophiocordyceps australis]|uniref:Uncharacterized protein n=1 Tax=Ophiocordyceps australis TaxID=1399860 RepID=A0A2C5YIM9_9HYPO|nr:hypothetical protein CDD81_5893 [Ophiocordyceps australis]
MRWTHSALSRIALNTLQGALLTTSCSLILFTEERRRRLKFTYTVLRNARKLRRLRNNPGGAALVQAWDSNSSRTNVDVAPGEQAKNRDRTRGRRRRRRPSTFITDLRERENVINRCDAARDHLLYGKPECSLASRAIKFYDTARSWLPDVSRTSLLELSILKPLLQRRPLHAAKNYQKNFHVRSFTSTRPYSTIAPLRSPQQAQAPTNTVIQETDEIATDLPERHEYLPKHVCDEARAALSKILQEIEELELLQEKENEATILQRVKILGRIDSGIHVMRKVASHSQKLPKCFTDFQHQSQQLLRIALKYNCNEALIIVMALYSISRDHTGETMRCLETIQGSESTASLAAIEQTLSWLCTGDGLAACDESGLRVYHILKKHNHTYQDFAMMAQLYGVMTKAGLFWKQMAHHSVEYKIRKYMLTMAIKNQSYDVATREIDALWRLDKNKADNDKCLNVQILVLEAKLRNWTEVSKRIERLRSVIKVNPLELNGLLGRVANILTRNEAPEQIDRQLRIFWSEFGFSPKPSWAYVILISYSKHRQLKEMLSWLKFCGECDIHLDEYEVRHRVGWIFRKYWSFGDRSMLKLFERAENVLTLCRGSQEKEVVRQQNQNGCGSISKLDKRIKVLTVSNGGQEKEVVRQKRYGGRTMTQMSDFKYGAYSRTPNWPDCRVRGLVLDLITPTSAKGISDAWQVIIDAKSQGQDVTKAFTPLLHACLDRGDTIDGVVEGLPEAGIRVHDSVYNRMARELCFRGDQAASIRVCHLASRRNGNGDAMYSPFNFANLILSYTFSHQNHKLSRILKSFSNKDLWWCGGPQCKQTIKLALKVMGRRIFKKKSVTPEEEYCIDLLYQAFWHVKDYRAHPSHRRAISNAYIEALHSYLTRRYGGSGTSVLSEGKIGAGCGVGVFETKRVDLVAVNG